MNHYLSESCVAFPCMLYDSTSLCHVASISVITTCPACLIYDTFSEIFIQGLEHQWEELTLGRNKGSLPW